MEEQFQSSKSDQLKALNIKEIFFKYVRFLPLLIISVALSLFVAYMYLRYATPVYQSSGSIAIQDANSNVSGDDRFQQLFGGGTKDIANEIELLRSRPLMEEVVEGLNLNFSYYLKGKLKDENRYNSSFFNLQPLSLTDSSTAFSIKLNFTNKGFKVNDDTKLISYGSQFKTPDGVFIISGQPIAGTEYQVTWESTSAIANKILGNLQVYPKGPTGILILTLEAEHPKLAADVINKLMRVYQQATIDAKNETSRRIIAFIDDRLKVVSKELDSVTNKLLSYQLANNIISPEYQSSRYFSRASEAEDQIADQQVQLNVAQLIINYLNDSKNATDLVPSSLGINDATLNNLISAYNVAQLERKSLIDANIPETSPRVKQKEDQIERLRKNLFENLQNLRQSYTASIKRLQQRSSNVEAQIKALPLKEQELQEIKKEQQEKQDLYNLLSGKREESAISLAGTISNTRIIDNATANPNPVKPDRKNIQLIAIVIGLAIPALIVLAIEVLNDKINSRNDIEKLTDVPVVGEVGHSYANDVLVVKPNNRGVVAEQFRIIRSNLQYIINNFPKPVILVTSSFSGEGKSYISTNLGAVMSLANKKTIILEFDIRKPKVLSHLGIDKKPGLTNYLLGKVTAEELPIQITGYENLYVLACGPIPPNPAELLLDSKLQDLFTYLKEAFDVVVMDTAPIGMVSDAMALSRFADCTMYIVRQGYTYKKQIGLVDDLHAEGKLPKMSIVLNDVKAQSGYGYYGKYSYGYGYGSGYFEDDTRPPGLMQRWFGWLGFKKKRKSKKA